MISEYIAGAMRKAHYELLPDDKLYYGEIPGIEEVYATEKNLEDCRAELQAVLEDWLLLSINKNLPVPIVSQLLM